MDLSCIITILYISFLKHLFFKEDLYYERTHVYKCLKQCHIFIKNIYGIFSSEDRVDDQCYICMKVPNQIQIGLSFSAQCRIHSVVD